MKTKSGYDYEQYAKARNQSKWTCRKALRDFEGNIEKEAKLNPKASYAYARSKLKTKEGIPDLEDENVNSLHMIQATLIFLINSFVVFLQQRTQTLSPISLIEPLPTP